jgi:hypothetical protein
MWTEEIHILVLPLLVLSTNFYINIFATFFTNYIRVTPHYRCPLKGGLDSNTKPNMRQAGALATYLHLVPQYPTALVFKAAPLFF